MISPVDATKPKGAEEPKPRLPGSVRTPGTGETSSAPADPLHQAIADLTASIRLAARLHAQLDRVTAEASRVVSLDARRRKNGDG